MSTAGRARLLRQLSAAIETLLRPSVPPHADDDVGPEPVRKVRRMLRMFEALEAEAEQELRRVRRLRRAAEVALTSHLAEEASGAEAAASSGAEECGAEEASWSEEAAASDAEMLTDLDMVGRAEETSRGSRGEGVPPPVLRGAIRGATPPIRGPASLDGSVGRVAPGALSKAAGRPAQLPGGASLPGPKP